MVSFPEDLLRALDDEAARRGISRSGLLQELAEDALRRNSGRRAVRMAEIHLQYGPPTDHGGHVAELVKNHRPET